MIHKTQENCTTKSAYYYLFKLIILTNNCLPYAWKKCSVKKSNCCDYNFINKNNSKLLSMTCNLLSKKYFTCQNSETCLYTEEQIEIFKLNIRKNIKTFQDTLLQHFIIH